MTNNNKKSKSKTNLSTKNIVSTKSSSLSTTPKSATTTPKLTATPKLLNSETPALPYSSTSTITMEDLITTVNSQDEKIQSLIAMNTSDLLKLELDKLKQCSRRSCLVVSGVELPRNKTSEKAEETGTKVRELFLRELGVNEDDFDYELDKAHRLPINSNESTRRNSPPNIICKFRTHRFEEQLYSQKKRFIGQPIEK